jgi:8-oxo-dGTP pyrophosphatase MutT (NUDIX family)
MKATYNEIIHYGGQTHDLGQKTVTLPFHRVSARAIFIRRSDGAILGVRHQPGRGVALPGGGVDDGETPSQALERELSEEGFTLIGADDDWHERVGVDYYAGYRELNFWFLITVEDVRIMPNPEIHAWEWVAQDENPWYPGMGAMILLLVQKYLPELVHTYTE